MGFRESFAIVERDIVILNPTSHEKLMLLAEWAKRWRIEGTGLEIDAEFVSFARERAKTKGFSKCLDFIEDDAKNSCEPHSCDT